MANPLISGADREKKTLHKVTIGGVNYPYYAVPTVYADLGKTVGVTVVKDADDLASDFNLRTFLKDGRVRFIKVSDTEGNVYRILCAGDNVISALANIKKKKINGKNLNTAWLPGKVSFR